MQKLVVSIRRTDGRADGRRGQQTRDEEQCPCHAPPQIDFRIRFDVVVSTYRVCRIYVGAVAAAAVSPDFCYCLLAPAGNNTPFIQLLC